MDDSTADILRAALAAAAAADPIAEPPGHVCGERWSGEAGADCTLCRDGRPAAV